MHKPQSELDSRGNVGVHEMLSGLDSKQRENKKNSGKDRKEEPFK